MAFIQYYFMKDTLFERLLEYFHISEEDYQKLIAPVTADNFSSGHHFDDMEKAVAIAKEAIANKDKIFIYGDYDADGIMSTSIVVKSFLLLGIIPSFYIPNRYNDGYGITLTKAKDMVHDGVKLVITVDNGISAFEPIKYLKDNGVKVLILDHHTVQDEVPKADAILHPTYSHFGDIASSAGFVSFMFSWALLGYFNKYLATLASISLISDMMPLLDYNRNFLRLVFKNYRDGEFYTIDQLKEGLPFDENAIGMKIAPKINALGRILDDDSINYIVRYFVTGDRVKIDKLLTWILSINEKRKNESRLMDGQDLNINHDEPAIIIMTDAKEGLLGLIANQLCSEYQKPVVVLTDEKDGDAIKGSCRAPEGFNVVEAFNYCGDIMITSGGHALAGGCSILKKDFDLFKDRFIAYTSANPLTIVKHDDIPLGLTEINDENYKIIESFSPFGESWKAPNFMIKHIRSDSLMFSKTGEHILSYVGEGVKLVGFNMPKSKVLEYSFIDLSGRVKKSFYRGRSTLEFNIKDYFPSAK